MTHIISETCDIQINNFYYDFKKDKHYFFIF